MRKLPAGMRTSTNPELLRPQAAAELALGMDGRGRPSPHELARDRESCCAGSVGAVGSMVSERLQRAGDVFDCILLEQADGGDAGRSSVQARCGVFYVNAAESEDRDLRPAGFVQGGEARRLRVVLLKHLFLKHRSEDGEVGGLGFGAEDFGGSVAGGGHEKVVSGQWPVDRN